MQIFYHQKKRKVKLDKVREGLRPITLRFRAKARKLILGSIGTPLDHLSVKGALDKVQHHPSNFPQWDFYTIRSVGMGNDSMPRFTL